MATNIQEEIEDRTFLSLIRRNTERRDWVVVRVLFYDWGLVLESRDND